LCEDVVERSPGDGIVKVSIRDNTLRGGGDQHVGAERLDVVDKLGVVLELLIADSAGRLDVKIETINERGTEGAGPVVIGLGTESSNQDLSKPLGSGIVGDVVI